MASNGLLVIGFSVTVLALAAIGAYGLVSHGSNRRSHESGIRVAIGASRRRVLALVVGDGLKLALLGIGVGAVLAVAVGRALQGFLFGASAFDPITLVVIALLMLAVTTLASLLPAWRAARANPIAALRPNAQLGGVVALGDGDVEPSVGAYKQPCAIGELDDELARVGLQDLFQHEAFRQGADASCQVVRAGLDFFRSN
jgi:hypothetical protein